jgi:hypothetical protein
MAIGHSRGNATILVTNTTTHLPHNLVSYHTLTYASIYSSAEIWAFTYRFAHIVRRIREQQNREPDNPIQEYLKEEKLAEAGRQITYLGADKEEMERRRRPIIFHPVEPGAE